MNHSGMKGIVATPNRSYKVDELYAHLPGLAQPILVALILHELSTTILGLTIARPTERQNV